MRLTRTDQRFVLLLGEPDVWDTVARFDFDDALARVLEPGTFDPDAGPLGGETDQIRDGVVATDFVLERTADVSLFPIEATVDAQFTRLGRLWQQAPASVRLRTRVRRSDYERNVGGFQHCSEIQTQSRWIRVFFFSHFFFNSPRY